MSTLSEELLKLAAPEPTPEGRWLYTQIHGVCPIHGTPMHYRDLEQTEMYCPKDEGIKEKRAGALTIPRGLKPIKVKAVFGKYKAMMKSQPVQKFRATMAKRSQVGESKQHERAEGQAMAQLLRSEQEERKAQQKGDRGAWQRAENKEHGALRRLVKLEKKEHPGLKLSSMSDELVRISKGGRA